MLYAIDMVPGLDTLQGRNGRGDFVPMKFGQIVEGLYRINANANQVTGHLNSIVLNMPRELYRGSRYDSLASSDRVQARMASKGGSEKRSILSHLYALSERDAWGLCDTKNSQNGEIRCQDLKTKSEVGYTRQNYSTKIIAKRIVKTNAI